MRTAASVHRSAHTIGTGVRYLLLVASALIASGTVCPADAPVKPLPGNKPCPYPPKAQKAFVAGPVRFVVDVRPDGTPAAVEVKAVPRPNLGFEDEVRQCLSQWRFEAAPAGETGLRRHEGRIAFRLDPAKEGAIQSLLQALAAAWNSGDMDAVQELSLQADDPPKKKPVPGYLREQIQGGGTGPWRMELASEVQSIEFLGPELATVRQVYRRAPVSSGDTNATDGEEQTLEAIVATGTRGWGILSFAPSAAGATGTGIVRVESGRIREPRKVKDVQPRYPDIAKQARLQGVVVIECLLSPDGKVRFARILRGVPLLNASALEAVRQWEYTPTLIDGRAVPIFMTVTVNFRLI
jgi:TonB family protein